jgi:8-oxo-dGTP pyrophosphatase MutT (NUDIX family)
MIRSFWGAVGTTLFWLLWPVWVVYFRFSGVRSRVLVVCGEEILFVQGWLGTKRWSLPGGGTKRRESSIAGAVRELFEETGIAAAESGLTKLGSYKHTRYTFAYHADLYCLSLSEKPKLKLRGGEIWSARWMRLDTIRSLKLDDEARVAFRRYRPPEQASLL